MTRLRTVAPLLLAVLAFTLALVLALLVPRPAEAAGALVQQGLSSTVPACLVAAEQAVGVMQESPGHEQIAAKRSVAGPASASALPHAPNEPAQGPDVLMLAAPQGQHPAQGGLPREAPATDPRPDGFALPA